MPLINAGWGGFVGKAVGDELITGLADIDAAIVTDALREGEDRGVGDGKKVGVPPAVLAARAMLQVKDDNCKPRIQFAL